VGEQLDPEELTSLIGKPPTEARRKGELLLSGAFARTGVWSLRATDREPGDLDAQIAELLDDASQDLLMWRDVSQRFKAELFCGLFLGRNNQGVGVSPTRLLKLGERNIELSFDIYGPDPT
jgi:hypothetical protein